MVMHAPCRSFNYDKTVMTNSKVVGLSFSDEWSVMCRYRLVLVFRKVIASSKKTSRN